MNEKETLASKEARVSIIIETFFARLIALILSLDNAESRIAFSCIDLHQIDAGRIIGY